MEWMRSFFLPKRIEDAEIEDAENEDTENEDTENEDAEIEDAENEDTENEDTENEDAENEDAQIEDTYVLQLIDPNLRDKFIKAQTKVDRIKRDALGDDEEVQMMEYLKQLLPLLFLHKRMILFISVHGEIPVSKKRGRRDPLPHTFIMPEENMKMKFTSFTKPGLCHFGNENSYRLERSAIERNQNDILEKGVPFNDLNKYMKNVVAFVFSIICGMSRGDVSMKNRELFDRLHEHCKMGDVNISSVEPGDEMIYYTYKEDKREAYLQEMLLYMPDQAEPFNIAPILFSKHFVRKKILSIKHIIDFFTRYSAVEELIVFDRSCSVYVENNTLNFMHTTSGLVEEVMMQELAKRRVKYGGSTQCHRKSKKKCLKRKTRKQHR